MKSFPFSLDKSRPNKLVSFTTSVIAALALTGGINAAHGTTLKTLTAKELTTVSIPFSQTQPAVTQTITRQIPYQSMGIEPLIIVPVIIFVGCFFFGGLVVIGEREVGIVVKKFTLSGKGLPPGRLIALNGEAGLQADTLAPGWYWGYWPWQYAVKKESIIVVPQGEIALIVAADGASNPPERILGKIVECDNFQDARKFLTKGGEKGRQIAFITAGTYRINTALFKVITAGNASLEGMRREQLHIYEVAGDKVGIVTTLDGSPIAAGEIAGRLIGGHDNFQNGQKFIDAGGQRGLQEQVLLSGSWNLNPWLVNIEQVPMTEIPIGYVGVVISFVGEDQEDVSGAAFTHGNLVHQGHKGVWVEPLYPGKHPLNTKVMKVELVPTTNIVLNFTDRISGQHGYDTNLKALKLLSFDGFSRETALADIQQDLVQSEQGVTIAELQANAQIQQATGEAEAVKLKAVAEAEAIRATGNAKAETYLVGVQALGLQGYTAMQLMQIVGDRNVRIIPDIIVGGNNGSNNGLVDGLLSMILLNQTNSKTHLESKILTPPQLPNPVVAKPESTNHNSQI